MKHSAISKIILAFVFAPISAFEFSYLFSCCSELNPEFSAGSIFFYMGVFAFFAVYARLPKPISPVIRFPSTIPRLIAVFWGLGVLIFSLINLESSENRDFYMRFMSLHAASSAAYSFFALLVIFGDDFIWPISKILKFGRDFQR